MKSSDFRTPLARVRGLGSAKDGTSHFLWQRITAIVLIPLSFWFISSLLKTGISSNPAALTEWLASGIHVAALILMLMALFYHAALGIQVVVEDYVHCPYMKMTVLLLNAFLMLSFAIISILAVLKLHFHMIPGVEQ